MRLRKLFACLLYLIWNSALAQNLSFVFHQLSIKDGLSENTVRSIAEDKRGYMWFGTEDGLNKYDGYKFTVYRNNPADPYSISSNNFKCFFSDSKGRLWIGSRHGVNIYDHTRNRFFNYNNGDMLALKHIRGDMECITEDKNGTIWIAAGEDGLYKVEDPLKPALNYVNDLKGLGKALIYICEDSNDGNLWVGTRDGLLKFDKNRKVFKDLRPLFGNDYHIRSILDEKDEVWLSTTDGLKIIDKKTNKIKHYVASKDATRSLSGNNTNKVIPLGNDKYLIGIDGFGLDVFDKSTQTFTHHSTESGSQLSSNNITSLIKDSKGTLWVGTFLNGINFSNITTNFFVHVKNKIGSSQNIQRGVITKFLKDSKGNFWIGTDGGGVYLKKKGEEVYTQFKCSDPNPLIEADAVTDILEDKDGIIWIATYTGGLTMWRYPYEHKVFKHKVGDSTSLCFDKLRLLYEYQDEIWVATYGEGISVFNKKKGYFRQYRHDPSNHATMPSTWVYRFLKDSQGTLWLATFNGLTKYIPESDSFKTFRFRKTDFWGNKNHIIDIYEDSRKNLWVGTYGAGLMLFDREKETFTAYIAEDGLSANSVKTIIEDDYSNLWLATNNGITQFNIPTRKAFPFTLEDGVPACSFFQGSKFKTPEGQIYFGANDGYLVINPKLSNTTAIFPKVILTELKIFNIPVEPGSPDSPLKTDISETTKIDLPYFKNSISLEFAALNFGIPKKNNYAYMLEGFDKDWIYAGKNRTVTYTNLDPGTYLFRVKASSDEKVWSQESSSFEIVITPPYWMTWWFRSLVILVIFSAIFGGFYYRTRRIIRTNKQLSGLVEERTKELTKLNDNLQLRNVEIMHQQLEILQQKNELEHLNKTKDKFFKIIGHDLKGPVKAIATLAAFLRSETEFDQATNIKQREAIKHMDFAAQQVKKLVFSLLEWARTQTEEIKIDPKLIAVNKLFDENLKLHLEQASQKELEIKINASEHHFVYADYNMISTVVRNIVSNSIKYTPRGGTITLASVDTDDKQLKISISDSGVGMTEEVLNRLFSLEKGVSVKGTENETGTGLGLIICKEFVTLNKGTLYAESKLNQGTTFYLILPTGKSQP